MHARTREFENRTQGADQLLFEGISETGTYFSNWSGHLIRAPEDGHGVGDVCDNCPAVENSDQAPVCLQGE